MESPKPVVNRSKCTFAAVAVFIALLLSVGAGDCFAQYLIKVETDRAGVGAEAILDNNLDSPLKGVDDAGQFVSRIPADSSHEGKFGFFLSVPDLEIHTLSLRLKNKGGAKEIRWPRKPQRFRASKDQILTLYIPYEGPDASKRLQKAESSSPEGGYSVTIVTGFPASIIVDGSVGKNAASEKECVCLFPDLNKHNVLIINKKTQQQFVRWFTRHDDGTYVWISPSGAICQDGFRFKK